MIFNEKRSVLAELKKSICSNNFRQHTSFGSDSYFDLEWIAISGAST